MAQRPESHFKIFDGPPGAGVLSDLRKRCLAEKDKDIRGGMLFLLAYIERQIDRLSEPNMKATEEE